MTCQELRSYLQEIERAEPEDQLRSTEIAAHTGICVDCGRFVEEQRELATGLRVVRESAPDVPASLDASVLASYRGLAAEEVNSRRLAHPRRRINMIAAFAWTAALAAAVIIANEELRFVVPTEEAAASAKQAAAPQVQAEGQSPVPITTMPKTITARSAHSGIARKRLRKPAAVFQRTVTNVPEAADANDSQPLEFRGLMYCDELSCGGPMEMIRVQLPPSAARLISGPTPNNEVVYADVLVGPDGIARGIRILK